MKQTIFNCQLIRKFSNICKLCRSSLLHRSYSTSVVESSSNHDAVSLPQYTDSQQKIILRVLNEFSAQELSRLDVTARRAALLHSFRSKRGRLECVSEVLSVKGLGERSAVSLFTSILETVQASADGEMEVKTPARKPNGSKTALVTPAVDAQRIQTLETVVGIHIGLNAVTWAMLDKNNQLLEWDLHDLQLDSKKTHPTVLLAKVLHLRNLLPAGDVFVFEDSPTSSLPAQQQLTSLTMQLRKSQIASMMLTALNTDIVSDGSVDRTCSLDRVFYLRYRSPARLFRTLVGSERVSAQPLVATLLRPPPTGPPPTHFTPVQAAAQPCESYESRDKLDREAMCQALLLSMAFMDLVIYKTPESLKVVCRG